MTATAASAVAIAGCAAASNSSVTATGRTLTLYVSAPSGVASNPQMQDVLDAERLAFQAKQNEVHAFTLRLRTLVGAKLSDNARTAIQDKSAIAYLGEILPGASADSLGITNAQDLLQVSPSDTAVELTQPTSAVPGAPGRYYESLKTYGRTFARVVPTTALEARALVQEMQALGVKRLYVTDDGTPYGRAIALAVKQDGASSLGAVAGAPTGAKFAASGADALFLGSNQDSVAERVFADAATAKPGAKLFGPSALDDNAVAASVASGKAKLCISSPGFLPSDLTPSGRQFVAAFKAAYNRAPTVEAIFGYEAMAAVLDVLAEAGASANNRSTVVHDFFAIKNRNSVLGTYSINANGDTSIAPFVISRGVAGKLVPFKFVQPQG